ncbi:MAG: hypothetical protein NC328_06615 [Muribaculum sp.]|nr:hypothetical protein [Muribaculum sp.]
MSQLYQLWRNFSIGMMALVAVIAFSMVLPFYLSPIIAVVATAALYTLLYNNKMSHDSSCLLIIYAVFYLLLLYSFSTIIINVLWMWAIIPVLSIPREMIFFNAPFIPALYLAPCALIVSAIFSIRKSKLQICKNCKLQFGDTYERGASGKLICSESFKQLRIMMMVFGIVTIIIYSYYFLIYNKINLNARDWYIYLWIMVIAITLMEIYFVFRYYNLYLDLKERDEVITDEGLQDVTAKTYLRFYVCCGNYLFIDPRCVDPDSPYREIIDTPFFTHRTVNGITVAEVRRLIERMTGVKDGELRFFFGRKSPNFKNHSIIRYFYFLKGDIINYPELNVDGEWINFERFKQIYARTPGKLAPLALSDLSRLATIMLTEKIFNEKGFRKNKLKSFSPNFTLEDVRNSDLDFQDDKWIKISNFNSDTPFYRLKRWWRGSIRGNKGSFQ